MRNRRVTVRRALDLRSQRRHIGKPIPAKPRVRRWRIDWRRFAPACLFLACALVGAILLADYFGNSIATKRANVALARMVEVAAPPLDVEADQHGSDLKTVSLGIGQSEVSTAATQLPTAKPVILPQYQIIGNDIIPSLQKLYSKNYDLIGYLYIQGVVSLPVVYYDNEWYLNHDYYGGGSKAGALFLDQAHPLAADTQLMVIHGHNMVDGSMFGILSHYKKHGYAAAHSNVSFSTIYSQEKYRVFAVLKISTDQTSKNYFAFTGTPRFETVEAFDAYISEMRPHAVYWDELLPVRADDALLALSTCDGDDRVVVFCVRVK